MSALPQKNPAGMSFREYAPAYLKIKTKDRRLIPFALNEPQLRLDAVIEERLASGKPVRIIILKARQQGFSTFSLGRGYKDTTTRPNTDGMMLCHDDDSTVKLFERVQTMYEFAPMRPMIRYSTRRELNFRNPKRAPSDPAKLATYHPGLMSSFAVATAGKRGVGRSRTLQFLHCSELAQWENASDTLLGVEQAIPNEPGTIEIIESTAQGVGNEFHERWKKATDPRTAGDWIALFFPWWEYRDYRLSVKEHGWYAIPASVDNLADFERDEQEQKELYGLDDDQLNWRRYAITNNCKGRLDKFQQEYPGNPEEAFLMSGLPVFNQKVIAHRIQVLRKADEIILDERKTPRFYIGKLRLQDGAAVWEDHPAGDFTVYEWPDRVSKYLISADVAEGIVKGDDSDYSVAGVWDRYSWELCAVYESRITPFQFARVLMSLGYFYNTALIAPEANNHGHSVCSKLEEEQYPSLHYRREYDTLGQPVMQKVGWETNVKTRPRLVDALDEAVNRNLAKLNHIPLLEQMLRFVNDPKTGKQQGDAGCHDDQVIMAGIACWLMQFAEDAPKAKQPVRPTGPPSAQLNKKLIEIAWAQQKGKGARN